MDLWHELEGGDYDAATRRLTSFKRPWGEWVGRASALSGGDGHFIKAALEVVGMRAGPLRLPSARVTGPLLDDLRALFQASGVPSAGHAVKPLVGTAAT